MKTGWKTTEFWALLVGGAVACLNQAFGWELPKEAFIAAAVAIAGYALSRGIAKSNTPGG